MDSNRIRLRPVRRTQTRTPPSSFAPGPLQRHRSVRSVRRCVPRPGGGKPVEPWAGSHGTLGPNPREKPCLYVFCPASLARTGTSEESVFPVVFEPMVRKTYLEVIAF